MNGNVTIPSSEPSDRSGAGPAAPASPAVLAGLLVTAVVIGGLAVALAVSEAPSPPTVVDPAPSVRVEPVRTLPTLPAVEPVVLPGFGEVVDDATIEGRRSVVVDSRHFVTLWERRARWEAVGTVDGSFTAAAPSGGGWALASVGPFGVTELLRWTESGRETEVIPEVYSGETVYRLETMRDHLVAFLHAPDDSEPGDVRSGGRFSITISDAPGSWARLASAVDAAMVSITGTPDGWAVGGSIGSVPAIWSVGPQGAPSQLVDAWPTQLERHRVTAVHQRNDGAIVAAAVSTRDREESRFLVVVDGAVTTVTESVPGRYETIVEVGDGIVAHDSTGRRARVSLDGDRWEAVDPVIGADGPMSISGFGPGPYAPFGAVVSSRWSSPFVSDEPGVGVVPPDDRPEPLVTIEPGLSVFHRDRRLTLARETPADALGRDHPVLVRRWEGAGWQATGLQASPLATVATTASGWLLADLDGVWWSEDGTDWEATVEFDSAWPLVASDGDRALVAAQGTKVAHVVQSGSATQIDLPFESVDVVGHTTATGFLVVGDGALWTWVDGAWVSRGDVPFAVASVVADRLVGWDFSGPLSAFDAGDGTWTPLLREEEPRFVSVGGGVVSLWQPSGLVLSDDLITWSRVDLGRTVGVTGRFERLLSTDAGLVAVVARTDGWSELQPVVSVPAPGD